MPYNYLLLKTTLQKPETRQKQKQKQKQKPAHLHVFF